MLFAATQQKQSTKSKRCALHQDFWKTLCRLANDFRHVLTEKICWHRQCCCSMGWLLFKCWLLFSLPSKSGCFSFWLVGCVGGFFFFGGEFHLCRSDHIFLLPIFLSGVDHFLHYFMLNFPIISAWCVWYFVKYNIEVYRFGNGNVHP